MTIVFLNNSFCNCASVAPSGLWDKENSLPGANAPGYQLSPLRGCAAHAPGSCWFSQRLQVGACKAGSCRRKLQFAWRRIAPGGRNARVGSRSLQMIPLILILAVTFFTGSPAFGGQWICAPGTTTQPASQTAASAPASAPAAGVNSSLVSFAPVYLFGPAPVVNCPLIYRKVVDVPAGCDGVSAILKTGKWAYVCVDGRQVYDFAPPAEKEARARQSLFAPGSPSGPYG